MEEEVGRRHQRLQLQEEEAGGPDPRRKKRGPVELKRIEDRISRQVRFSKRRSGLFKKGFELSVLCDAKVALLVFSPAGRLYEYVSSNTSIEELFTRCRDVPNTINGLDHEARDSRIDHNIQLDLNEKSAPDSISELNDFAQWALESDVNEMSMAELRRLEEIVTDALAVIKKKLTMKVSELTQTEKKRKDGWSPE